MNKQEALIEMIKGKTVVRPQAKPGWEYYFDTDKCEFFGRKVATEEGGYFFPIYEKDGYEIKTEKKTVRVWQFLKVNGKPATQWYTEDKSKRLTHLRTMDAHNIDTTGWIKTNCYADVEVEV